MPGQLSAHRIMHPQNSDLIVLVHKAAFHLAVQPDASDPTDDPLTNGAEGADIKKLSHGVAVILLFSALHFSPSIILLTR